MDKFLSNLPENLKFSINETISIFILILTIMLITKISIKKKWITEEQSVISSVVIAVSYTHLDISGQGGTSIEYDGPQKLTEHEDVTEDPFSPDCEK